MWVNIPLPWIFWERAFSCETFGCAIFVWVLYCWFALKRFEVLFFLFGFFFAMFCFKRRGVRVRMGFRDPWIGNCTIMKWIELVPFSWPTKPRASLLAGGNSNVFGFSFPNLPGEMIPNLTNIQYVSIGLVQAPTSLTLLAVWQARIPQERERSMNNCWRQCRAMKVPSSKPLFSTHTHREKLLKVYTT